MDDQRLEEIAERHSWSYAVLREYRKDVIKSAIREALSVQEEELRNLRKELAEAKHLGELAIRSREHYDELRREARRAEAGWKAELDDVKEALRSLREERDAVKKELDDLREELRHDAIERDLYK